MGFVACFLGRLRTIPARTLLLATCLGVLLPVTALAWVYSEHRDITVLAVQQLEPAQRALLEKLWSEARAGHEARLCAQLADTTQGPNPTCIDYAAWPAIGGDHSCSARDMLSNVLDTPWILDVARISAQLKRRLAGATRRDQRINAVRDSDIALQRADLDYATRAGSNNVHFLLARPDVAIEPEAYARLALGPGAELNAMGAYVWYHLRALAQAARLARGDLAPAVRAQVALAALADEAFALHFLEDSFAAGHGWHVGRRGCTQGTHDYYNERGVEVVTWAGRRFVAQGDAYMGPQDAERAATAVRDSLAQLIGALDGKVDTDAAADAFEETEPDAFDVCQQSHFPAAAGTVADIRALVPIIEQTPVPALGPGSGELPRFHAELGPFVGVSAAARGATLAGGFGSTQTGASTTGGLEAAVRVGLGLEGVLNESGDGLVFAEVGLRQDAATARCSDAARPHRPHCAPASTLLADPG